MGFQTFQLLVLMSLLKVCGVLQKCLEVSVKFNNTCRDTGAVFLGWGKDGVKQLMF